MLRQPGIYLVLASLLLVPGLRAEPVKQPIKLFNGKDLTNFYTWLNAPKSPDQKEKTQAYGKNNDPEKVFTVQDGMIRVSGKVFGCFTTEKEFDNYHLIVEFKWGDKTWYPREKGAMDSGILLHCVGEDGAAGGNWMESIECQMIEGGTGDFILVKGKNQPTMMAEVEYRPTFYRGKESQQPYFKPGAPAKQFPPGRINWYGRDPNWDDVKGFRGKEDVERPAGEWNTVECICDGGTITNVLNGKVVNRGTQASLTRGKILFQSEGAEVFFRRIDLQPLKK